MKTEYLQTPSENGIISLYEGGENIEKDIDCHFNFFGYYCNILFAINVFSFKCNCTIYCSHIFMCCFYSYSSFGDNVIGETD